MGGMGELEGCLAEGWDWEERENGVEWTCPERATDWLSPRKSSAAKKQSSFLPF